MQLNRICFEEISLTQSRIEGRFQTIFQDLFLLIFVRAFLNIECIEFYYLAKNMHNDFQL